MVNEQHSDGRKYELPSYLHCHYRRQLQLGESRRPAESESEIEITEDHD